MPQGNWDTKQIKTAGTKLVKKSEDMLAILRQAAAVVNDTEHDFNTPEGRQMRQQFATLNKTFQKFQADVKSFGDYIHSYGVGLDDMQSQLKGMAQGLPSSDY